MRYRVENLEGEDFAGYRVEKLIGRGRMSFVYLARNPAGIQIALKVLDPDLGGLERFRERFIYESDLAREFRHANIVPVNATGAVGEILYIEMRYVSGGTLRDRLSEQANTRSDHQKRIDIDSTVSVARQIATALDAGHERGLVHRDVKPENILLEPEREGDIIGRAYLADFGMALDLSAQKGISSVEDSIGTHKYSAPEQYRRLPVGPSTDVYSLACVIYECLAGQPPFNEDDFGRLQSAILKDSPRRLTGADPTIPLQVDAVLQQALDKDPAQRYSTCMAFADALKDAARYNVVQSGYTGPADPPPPPPPPAPPEPPEPRRPGLRQRALTVRFLAAAVVLLLAAGVFIYVVNPNSNNTNGSVRTLTGPLGKAVDRMMFSPDSLETQENLAKCRQTAGQNVVECRRGQYQIGEYDLRDVAFTFRLESSLDLKGLFDSAVKSADGLDGPSMRGRNRGYCGTKPLHWHNEDDWFHTITANGALKNEIQDASAPNEKRFTDAMRMPGDWGHVVCYMDPPDSVIVWTEATSKMKPTHFFLGTITARKQSNAYHAWYETHHALMPPMG